MSIQVVIVNPDIQLRQHIAGQLKRLCLIGGIWEAENVNTAMHCIRNNTIDVVMTDVILPEGNGTDFTQRILKEYPRIKIVAYTSNCGARMVWRMLNAGASGYLLTGCDDQEVANTFLHMMSNRIYVCRTLENEPSSRVVSYGMNTGPSRRVEFTTREMEVIRGIEGEKTNKEIALLLGLSLETVRSHRRRIMKKIGTHNSAGIIKFLYDNKISFN